MTVEPTPTLSAEDAYRLTQRIRTAASGAREAMETYPELQHYRARHAHAAGAHHGRGVPVSDPQVHESIDGQPVGGAFALLSGATRPSECRSTSIAPTPRSPGHSPSGERGVRAPGVPAPCRTHKASGPARQLPTITRGTAQPNKEDIHVQSYRH